MVHYFCNEDIAAFLRHDAQSILLISKKYHSFHNLILFFPPTQSNIHILHTVTAKIQIPTTQQKGSVRTSSCLNTLHIQQTQIKRVHNVILPYLLRYVTFHIYNTVHCHETFDILMRVTEETSLLIIGVVSLGKQFSSL